MDPDGVVMVEDVNTLDIPIVDLHQYAIIWKTLSIHSVGEPREEEKGRGNRYSRLPAG